MGSISLDNITTPVDANQGSLYRDLFLDLEKNNVSSDRNLYKEDTSIDIRVSLDEGAIKNSIRNIFNTIPGQKILTPQFGINLAKYLFQPINDNTTSQIHRDIVIGLQTFEPRVSLQSLEVIPNIDAHEYNITIILTIPSLNNVTNEYISTLTQDGLFL